MVPDHGDPNGHARITVTLERAARQVCYDIRKTKIETAAAAHIHRGVAGKAGPVVVAFFGAPKGAGRGRITGCARNVSRTRIDQIARNPRGFYANIHTRTYPAGSVRGQLGTRR